MFYQYSLLRFAPTNKQIEIMIVIKCNKVAESYDWFTKVGKGSFNLELYAKILQVKGVKSKVEFIKVK